MLLLLSSIFLASLIASLLMIVVGLMTILSRSQLSPTKLVAALQPPEPNKAVSGDALPCCAQSR